VVREVIIQFFFQPVPDNAYQEPGTRVAAGNVMGDTFVFVSDKKFLTFGKCCAPTSF
jgi:hypothetical protein